MGSSSRVGLAWSFVCARCNDARRVWEQGNNGMDGSSHEGKGLWVETEHVLKVDMWSEAPLLRM